MNEELGKWNRLIKRQDELYHKCARRSGLTDAQFWVLYAVCEEDQLLCQNTFCENWCYSKQTVSTAVSGLEKSGLIQLSYAKGSKKQKDITLTMDGELFCDKYIRSLQAAEEKVLKSLSHNEREAFFHTLERLQKKLENELL